MRISQIEYKRLQDTNALKGPGRPLEAIAPGIHIDTYTLGLIRSNAAFLLVSGNDASVALAWVQATLDYLTSIGAIVLD